MAQYMRGGQNTTSGSQKFFPFTVWVPGIELQSSGLQEIALHVEPSHQPLTFCTDLLHIMGSTEIHKFFIVDTLVKYVMNLLQKNRFIHCIMIYFFMKEYQIKAWHGGTHLQSQHLEPEAGASLCIGSSLVSIGSS